MANRLSDKQIRNIEMSRHPSPETIPWLQGLDMSNPAAGSIWQKFRISQVRASANDLLSLASSVSDFEARLLEILQEAQDVDNEVALWAANLPLPCRQQTWKLDATGHAESIDNLPDTIGEARNLHSEPPDVSTQYILTYADIWYASLWHGHRTSRLMLNETIIRLARRLDLPSITQNATSTIQQMVSETCASIAFSLSDVQVRTDESGYRRLDLNIDSRIEQGGGAGAYFVVWSLRHVVICEFASDTQIQTASETLVRIGAQFGSKQAFTLANGEYQCHL